MPIGMIYFMLRYVKQQIVFDLPKMLACINPGFNLQLEDAEDGFSVIADYFSKNTMAFAKLID
jgi:hypothetical protein